MSTPVFASSPEDFSRSGWLEVSDGVCSSAGAGVVSSSVVVAGGSCTISVLFSTVVEGTGCVTVSVTGSGVSVVVTTGSVMFSVVVTAGGV